MRDFVAPSNPQLDKIIESAQTPQELRELMLQNLNERGVIQRTREDQFYATGKGVPPAPQPPSFPVSDAAPTCMRVFYPHANDRYEIYGSSEMELDAKEAAIRAMYR